MSRRDQAATAAGRADEALRCPACNAVQPPERVERRLYRIRTAAELLDVPVETLRSWRRAGLIEFLRVGNCTFVSRSELERFIARARAGELAGRRNGREQTEAARAARGGRGAPS